MPPNTFSYKRDIMSMLYLVRTDDVIKYNDIIIYELELRQTHDKRIHVGNPLVIYNITTLAKHIPVILRIDKPTSNIKTSSMITWLWNGTLIMNNCQFKIHYR